MELIPKDKWTKDQRDFSQNTFKTPRGGQLVVTSVYKGKGGVAHFGLECSICSKDEELYPEGSIRSVKKSLLKGQAPCGCSFNPKWKEWQNNIRVERICKVKGYVFFGWFKDYKGIHTYLDLYNPRTGNRWKTTTINNLVLGHGDPVEGVIIKRDKRFLPDSYHISEFTKAGFSEEYKFWRSDKIDSEGRKRYWFYTCPVCSIDDYVKNGVCSGVFETNEYNLKKGFYACRCGRSFHYTKDQSELRLKMVCSEENLIYEGWVGNYTGVDSKFTWYCHHGHKNTTSVSNFINGCRCRKCKDIGGIVNGFYPQRSEEKDYLYIISFKAGYIKVGRTFSLKDRLSGNRGLLRMSEHNKEDIEILHTFTGKHKEVYKEEQWLHEELETRGFHFNSGKTWSTELFYTDCYETLLYLLKDTPLEPCDLEV